MCQSLASVTDTARGSVTNQGSSPEFQCSGVLFGVSFHKLAGLIISLISGISNFPLPGGQSNTTGPEGSTLSHLIIMHHRGWSEGAPTLNNKDTPVTQEIPKSAEATSQRREGDCE